MDNDQTQPLGPTPTDHDQRVPPTAPGGAGFGDPGSGDDRSGEDGHDDGQVDAAGGSVASRKRRRGSRGGRNRKRPGTAGDADDRDGDEGDGDAMDDGDGDAARSTARPAAAVGAAGDRDREEADRSAVGLTATVGSADRGAVATSQPGIATSVAPRPAGAASSVGAAGDDVTDAMRGTDATTDVTGGNGQPRPPRRPAADTRPELPDRLSEGRASIEAANHALVRKPQIGDTRPAPGAAAPAPAATKAKRPVKPKPAPGESQQREAADVGGDAAKKRRKRITGPAAPFDTDELDAEALERRRGRERNGRPVGRYMMCVQVRPTVTQVAVLEGRNLIEHYVSRPADDVSQIHGNIYLGKVQNVLPGMEAAFVDIGTPKNAVLYRGDVQYDAEDIVENSANMRIEQLLRAKQLLVCQVTKNPIGAKGARLTQEVSLPGRFVVLIPNSKTYGISKRLPDDVRKRLRAILDRVKPAEHGLIVRTAAEHATEHELRADMTRLLEQWNTIEAKAKRANSPTLLYREPELAVRVIREEFNAEYRGVIIDDQRLFEDVRDYVGAFNPELADRVEFYDAEAEGLPLYERNHIHEQLHKALDRKVWLPSGGSLIIEHTEALTVIDVNTGKNVGTSNLEETVFRNNLEAAEEVAKQLRLRDIGGIVVIDFIDMEIKDNRRKVVEAFRSALARDKTRTQVFDITELGLVEMTRKRIGEGLLVNFAEQCPNCEGRGVLIDHALID
jgi:ribonuclease E